jgi:hypothetical protein
MCVDMEIAVMLKLDVIYNRWLMIFIDLLF